MHIPFVNPVLGMVMAYPSSGCQMFLVKKGYYMEMPGQPSGRAFTARFADHQIIKF